MKNWFSSWRQFKLSNALDQRTAQPEVGPGQVKELDPFHQPITRLDAELKATVSSTIIPPQLHRVIMQAIEAVPASGVNGRTRARDVLRLRYAVSVALTVVACLLAGWSFVVQKKQQDQDSLNAPAMALQVGNEIKPMVTSAAVQPLSTELERVNQDLGDLAQFVLASIP
jgi:hypothetical protein